MSRVTPNPLDRRPPSRRPAGTVGATDTDTRGELLALAGITQEKQAEATKKAFEKKVELLEATSTKQFQFEGEVVEAPERKDNATQLAAAEALDRMLGVQAPPATRKVTVVHTLEWPEWFRLPEEEKVITLESEGKLLE